MRIIGAGLGRTGTHSLKLALEQLLGAPCYHMVEVFEHPEHIPRWQAAVDGTMPDWPDLFSGYRATVDWPGAAFWREISAAYPDALVLLSTRADADAWWTSASRTIFEATRREPPDDEVFGPQHRMVTSLLARRFTPGWTDEADAKAAYDAHNAAVRAEAPADRLVEWQPGDGWEPICAALGVDVPAEPFPHVNTTDDFRAMLGL
jgi:hypothetical protein